MTLSATLDGATRNARGDLKFNRHTKRARDAERAEDDRMMDDLPQRRNGPDLKKSGDAGKKRSRQVGRLGDEFRAKVSWVCNRMRIS